MINQYTSANGEIIISLRYKGKRNTAWALYVNGQYKGSKILPNNNTAVVQNFGFNAEDFPGV